MEFELHCIRIVWRHFIYYGENFDPDLYLIFLIFDDSILSYFEGHSRIFIFFFLIAVYNCSSMNCDIIEMIIVFNIYHLIGASLCHKGDLNGIQWDRRCFTLPFYRSCQSSNANFSHPLHFSL